METVAWINDKDKIIKYIITRDTQQFYLLKAEAEVDEFNCETPWSLQGSISENDLNPVLDDFELLGLEVTILTPEDFVLV